MIISNERMKVLHNGINVITLTLAMLLFCDHFFLLKVPIPAIILSGCMIYSLFLFISYNKKNIYIYLMAFGVLLCVFLFSLIWQKNLIYYIIDTFRWFLQYENGRAGYQTAYAFLIVFLFII